MQPTPVADTARVGHFLSRDAALVKFKSRGANPCELVDLSTLPSKFEDKNKVDWKSKGERDSRIIKEIGDAKLWEASKVRAVVACFHCTKFRCIFSSKTLDEDQGIRLQRRIEDSRFVCGTLLFQDSDPFSKIFVQKTKLDCDMVIEKSYYNVDNCHFTAPPITALRQWMT